MNLLYARCVTYVYFLMLGSSNTEHQQKWESCSQLIQKNKVCSEKPVSENNSHTEIVQAALGGFNLTLFLHYVFHSSTFQAFLSVFVF